jgi:hypothetical protein
MRCDHHSYDINSTPVLALMTVGIRVTYESVHRADLCSLSIPLGRIYLVSSKVEAERQSALH